MGYEKKKSWKVKTERFDDTVSYQRNGKTVTRIHKPLSDENLEKRRARVHSKEEVLKICRQSHGDKFDYSLLEYETLESKVKIICPIHGVFEVSLSSHMNGVDCAKCVGNTKLSQEEVIQRFKDAHGDKYDYSKVVYVGGKKKVTVICPLHGCEFYPRPIDHWNGKGGCPECKKDKLRQPRGKRAYGTRINMRRVGTDLELIKELREQGLTIKQISIELGLSHGTTIRRLKEIESLSKT